MTMEPIITADLAVLGEENRRNLPALDGAGVYRDDRPGVEARRTALAEQRRNELALMPLSLAHVFSHRVARAAAGGAALSCALLLAMLASDRVLVSLVEWFVPGITQTLPLLVAMSGCAVAGAYVIGGWAAEHVFARRMRVQLASSGDAHEDLDRLAQGPADVAHQLVRSVDAWAVGLSIAGVTALGTMFAYLLATLGVHHGATTLLSQSYVFGDHTVQSNIEVAMFTVALAAAFAAYVGHACRRERRLVEPPRVLRWAGHWLVIPTGIIVGFFAMHRMSAMAERFLSRPYVRRLPTMSERLDVAILGVFALVLLVTWPALWWRRREQARIGE
jgi:hypothetical protein